MVTLRATALDENGVVVLGRPVGWASLNPAIATVDSATGIVVAVQSGQAVISATGAIGAGAAPVSGYALVTVATPGRLPVGALLPEPNPATDALNALWGVSPSEVYAVGAGGTVLRSDGASWVAMESPTTEDLRGVWGVAPYAPEESRAWAVGERGTILRLVGSEWRADVSETDRALTGVWGASPIDVFAVGEQGTVVRNRGRGWLADTTVGTTANLRAVWGSSATDVYAVGDAGTILHYDGEHWADESAGTSAILTGVWGAGPDEVFVSGADGSVLRSDGSGWRVIARDTSTGYYAVWGASSEEVYVAGAGGAVLRWDGATWERLACAASATLRALWGTSEGVVRAVGAEGTVVAGQRSGASGLVVAGMTAGTVRVGSPIALEVRIVDAKGRAVEGAADTVHVALGHAPGGAQLLGPRSVAAVNGVARFAGLIVTRPGDEYTLVATAGAYRPAQSPAFRVVAGSLDRLGFVVQPASIAQAGGPMGVEVAVAGQDAFGNTLPPAAGLPAGSRVSLVVASGPSTTLRGPNAATVAGGVARFVGLSALKVGGGYRLRASSSVPGILPAVSDSFTVLGPGRAATVTVVPDAVVLAALGQSDSLEATAVDSFGNDVPTAGAAWRSLNPAVGEVGSSTGVVVAARSGQTSVAAMVQGATGYTTLTVSVPGAAPVREWTAMESGTTVSLNAVWAYSGSRVFAVGDSRTILRLDGTAWGQPYQVGVPSHPEAHFSSITGVGAASVSIGWYDFDKIANRIYLGVVEIESDEALATPMVHEYQLPGSIRAGPAVWAPYPGVVWAFGKRGCVTRLSPTNPAGEPVGTPCDPPPAGRDFWSGFGTGERDVHAVGDTGVVWSWHGSRPVYDQLPSQTTLRAIWGTSPTDLYAVGETGLIVHFDGTAWTPMASGTTTRLRGLWGSSPTDIYVVGESGLILHYDGVAWAPMASGTAADLRGVHGAPTGEVFVVGAGGVILKGTR